VPMQDQAIMRVGMLFLDVMDVVGRHQFRPNSLAQGINGDSRWLVPAMPWFWSSR